MLGRIGQNDQNSEILTKNSEINAVDPVKSNSYAKVDKNLLIDETNISDAAMKLWEREKDVMKFSKLALSDPDDKTAEELVEKQGLTIDDDEMLFGLLNNKQFLEDIAM